jgi:hypothetical protein
VAVGGAVVVVLVLVHGANGLCDMVAVVAYRQLRRMASAALVDPLELACSVGGLWERGRLGQHLHLHVGEEGNGWKGSMTGSGKTAAVDCVIGFRVHVAAAETARFTGQHGRLAPRSSVLSVDVLTCIVSPRNAEA